MCVNMNDKLRNYLDEDENIGIRKEYIGLINEHLKDDIPCIDLNNNKPIFTEDDKKLLEGRSDYPFTDIDLRRCGVAFACIRDNTLSKPLNSPDSSDKRPKIHSKPSGFPKLKENIVNDRLIFQRCHLIGYRLYKIRNDKSKENVNLKKIFTGTRFMNNVMYHYEKKIYEYVYETKNHVLYRVTPYFKYNDKLAKYDKLVSGVQMEAMFFNESGNEDIDSSFNVFVYNKQPYIEFDYETGKDLTYKMPIMECNYVIDKKKRKFHIKDCASVWDFDNDRMDDFPEKTRKDLIYDGYLPCAICDPGD